MNEPSDILDEAKLAAAQSLESRFRKVTELCATARQTGFVDRLDSDICTAAGFADISDYWKAALLEGMPTTDFIGLLMCHSANPDNEEFFDESANALRAAWAVHETFFAPNGSGLFDFSWVRPLEAAIWLSSSRRKHLVPETLRRYLEASGPGIDQVNQKQKRGPKFKKDTLAAREWLKSQSDETLGNMTRDSLQLEFHNISSSTCRDIISDERKERARVGTVINYCLLLS